MCRGKNGGILENVDKNPKLVTNEQVFGEVIIAAS
jgi:hypothetical protein